MAHLLTFFLIPTLCIKNVVSLTVIYAVNCGGPEHTDIHGVRYQRDMSNIGVASDYGKNLVIGRVVNQDQILYQTERYHTSSFSYDIPIPSDGDYVLILKFSEVWFASPHQKVFDVMLNGEHTIVSSLDIFAKVGRGVAHDEVVPFKAKDGRLFVGSHVSQISHKRVSVELVKGDRDNPKINAILLVKGSPDEVPRLPPLPQASDDSTPLLPDDEDEFAQQRRRRANSAADGDEFAAGRGGPRDSAEDEEAQRRRSRLASGPKTADPYQTDPASTALLPVLIAVAAALPLFFCLCKL